MHITLKWQERNRDIIAGAWPWCAICCLQWPSKAAVEDKGRTGKFWFALIITNNNILQEYIHLSQVIHSLSNLCLTVPSGATSDSLTLQVWFCLENKRLVIKWDDIMLLQHCTAEPSQQWKKVEQEWSWFLSYASGRLSSLARVGRPILESCQGWNRFLSCWCQEWTDSQVMQRVNRFLSDCHNQTPHSNEKTLSR